jgi:hypothetical protein
VLHAAIIAVKVNVRDWYWVKDLCGMGAASPKSFKLQIYNYQGCEVIRPSYAPHTPDVRC